jgi:hypothetical protein
MGRTYEITDINGRLYVTSNEGFKPGSKCFLITDNGYQECLFGMQYSSPGGHCSISLDGKFKEVLLSNLIRNIGPLYSGGYQYLVDGESLPIGLFKLSFSQNCTALVSIDEIGYIKYMKKKYKEYYENIQSKTNETTSRDKTTSSMECCSKTK